MRLKMSGVKRLQSMGKKMNAREGGANESVFLLSTERRSDANKGMARQCQKQIRDHAST